MIRIIEVIIGVILIYAGLERFSTADQVKGVLYGVISIAGLVLAVHGILLFNVPGFF